MNSSGIKRGAAVLTVAALAIGTPVAVYAATNGDGAVYSITQSADKTSLPQYSLATIDGKATAKGNTNLYTGGADAANNPSKLSVTISETLPAGTTIAWGDNLFKYDADGKGAGAAVNITAGDAAPASADTGDVGTDVDSTEFAALLNGSVLKADTTFTTVQQTSFVKTSGEFEYSVGSNFAGSVSAKSGDASVGGTATTTLTVTKVNSGVNNVASIDVDPATVNSYTTDDDTTFTVTPLDSTGTPVNGVVVKVWDGTTSTVVGTSTITSGAGDGSLEYTIAQADHSTAGTKNLVFYVDPATSPTQDRPDGSDPQKAASATYVAPVNLAADTISIDAGDATIPADGTAITVPVKVTITDADDAAVVGVRVAVDAVASGPTPDYTNRQVGVTGADGSVTLTFSFPKEASANGQTLVFTAYETGATEYNTSTDVQLGNTTTGGTLDADSDNPTTITFASRAVDVYFGGSNAATVQAQATAGGTVSLPIVVKDQFGKPVAGATLGYQILHATGNRGNDTTADKPITTDADGKATITYTDAKLNSVTSTDKDRVLIKDSFGSFGGGTLQEIDVQFLTALTADATLSLYKDNVTAAEVMATNFGATSETAGSPNATTGVPGQGTTVGFAGLEAFGTAPAQLQTYGVKAVAADGSTPLANHDVTFTATGSPTALLFDASTLADDAPVNGVGTLTVKTNSAGYAYVFVTTLTSADVTVKATSDAFSHTFKPVRFEPDAAWNVSLTSKPASVQPGSQVRYVYTVTDEFGNKVYGFGKDGLDKNPNFSIGSGSTTLVNDFDSSVATATSPGTVTQPTAVDSNSQFAVVLTTFDSDNGPGSFKVTPQDRLYPGAPASTYWNDASAAAFVKKYGANAQLAALIKPYVGADGLTTEFTVGASKTDPTLSATAKTQVTKKVQKFKVKNAKGKFVWVGKAKVGKKHVYGKKKVASVKKDTVVVSTNAPAGTVVTVNGKTAAVADGSATFTFTGIKTVNKVRTYTVSVPATDTTNAKTITVTVK